MFGNPKEFTSADVHNRSLTKFKTIIFQLNWQIISVRWRAEYDTDWILICSSKQKKQKGRSQRLHYQPISVKHADLYVWSYWLTRVGDEWPMTVGREHQTVPTAGWSVSDRSGPAAMAPDGLSLSGQTPDGGTLRQTVCHHGRQVLWRPTSAYCISWLLCTSCGVVSLMQQKSNVFTNNRIIDKNRITNEVNNVFCQESMNKRERILWETWP